MTENGRDIRREMPSAPWRHAHTFGQDEKKPGEGRTLTVALLTVVTMVLEIVAGLAYGSMALLADGLHMASHASALTISMIAYVYARRYARDARFSFGTGKVNSLAGFSGAMMLAMFALIMVWESLWRLIRPVPIAFNQALWVALVGLIVNGISVFILSPEETRDHRDQDEDTFHSDRVAPEHDRPPSLGHAHDHNLRAAYLHVLADTMTSFLAIFALSAGKTFGLWWLDPVMGVVGAVLVARWSLGLLRITGRVLLDRQAPAALREAVRSAVARSGDEVADLHLWATGPGTYALILSVVSNDPKPPDHYRALLPRTPRLVHVTVEVWHRGG